MRNSICGCLHVPEDLHCLCPDQKQNLNQIHSQKSDPLSKLVDNARRNWGYRGHVLLLSMWLCLLSTDEVLKRPLDDVTSSHPALVDHVVSAFREHGAAPHPEVLLKEILG